MAIQLSAGIFTVDNVLTKEKCTEIIAKCYDIGWNASAPSGGGHGRTGREGTRTSKVVSFDDPVLATTLFNEAKKHLPTDASFLADETNYNYRNHTNGDEWTIDSCHTKIRAYKYDKGDSFPEHYDYGMRRVSVKDGKKTTYQSFVTVLVYLNDDFEGGHTVYWPDQTGIHCRFVMDADKQGNKKNPAIDITPKTGTMVLQGQEILHEGQPPSGTKYILRTDILYKRTVVMDPRLKVKDYEGEFDEIFEPGCKNFADKV